MNLEAIINSLMIILQATHARWGQCAISESMSAVAALGRSMCLKVTDVTEVQMTSKAGDLLKAHHVALSERIAATNLFFMNV